MRNLQNIQVRTGSGFETVCPFPVGAIYQSTSSTSPASIYGGGWTPLTDGRFLRPQGSWNNLGGENTHKLTVAEMPSHFHYYPVILQGYSQSGTNAYGVYQTYAHDQGQLSTRTEGGNAAHNNIPAYRTCYCWYRTS